MTSTPFGFVSDTANRAVNPSAASLGRQSRASFDRVVLTSRVPSRRFPSRPVEAPSSRRVALDAPGVSGTASYPRQTPLASAVDAAPRAPTTRRAIRDVTARSIVAESRRRRETARRRAAMRRAAHERAARRAR